MHRPPAASATTSATSTTSTSTTSTSTTRATGYAVAPATTAAVAVGAIATALAGRLAITSLAEESAVSWVLARASGLTAYLLLTALVTTGLTLAHPAVAGRGWPTRTTRLTVHVALATFTLVFTVLHVVVLATDQWVDVGWAGALLPFASGYRPVGVTLGVLALWSGLITGVTARLAGRVAARVWWPVHKVAAAAFVLVWAHGVVAGSDTPSLAWFYGLTGAAVLGLAVSRYAARTPAEHVDELARSLTADPDAPVTTGPVTTGPVTTGPTARGTR